MTNRVLITGVDGFVGRHLARIAADAGWEVAGITRSETIDPSLRGDLSLHYFSDLTKCWPAEAPTEWPIIHLAGLAAVGPSFQAPQQYIEANSSMVTNMCEAVLSRGSRSGRIIGVSTGAVYAPPHDGPLNETSAVSCSSPYVVSKLLVENQLDYYRHRGLDTVVARPFNHFGPGQARGFLVPDLLDELHNLSPSGTLRVGNIATRRDYSDVRDVARAYLALISAAVLRHEVYNIASGEARSGYDVLDNLCIALGRPRPSLRVDESRIRATDPPEIVGDPTRLREDTTWAPEYTFDRSIRDTIESSRRHPSGDERS